MSRSGYSEDCCGWEVVMWRGAVDSAIKGERGQGFLRRLIAALDAMPEKRLVEHDLQNDQGVCALGAVCLYDGIDPKSLHSEQHEKIGGALNIAPSLVREIEFLNDDDFNYGRAAMTDEERWREMRAWAESNLKALPFTESKNGQS